MKFPIIEIIPIIAAVLGGIVASMGFLKARRALHAKHKMQQLLLQRSTEDETLQKFRERIMARGAISPAEVAEIRKIIEEMTSDLSEEEKNFVENGLHQESQAGVQGYVSSLLDYKRRAA